MKNETALEFKIGDAVTLKRNLKSVGLIKNIVKKRIDNGPSDMIYLYKVFWFNGQGDSKLYSALELALNVKLNKKGKIH